MTLLERSAEMRERLRKARHNRYLTVAQEREIVALRRAGVTAREVALRFGVSRGTVFNTARRGAQK